MFIQPVYPHFSNVNSSAVGFDGKIPRKPAFLKENPIKDVFQSSEKLFKKDTIKIRDEDESTDDAIDFLVRLS